MLAFISQAYSASGSLNYDTAYLKGNEIVNPRDGECIRLSSDGSTFIRDGLNANV